MLFVAIGQIVIVMYLGPNLIITLKLDTHVLTVVEKQRRSRKETDRIIIEDVKMGLSVGVMNTGYCSTRH